VNLLGRIPGLKRPWLIVMALVVVAVGAVAYTQLVPPSRTVSFKLLAAEYAFSDGKDTNPTLTVRVGDTVQITVRNVGGIDHEFMVVKDLNASIAQVEQGKSHPMPAFGTMMTGMVNLHPREEKTVTFTADKPGTFYYVCLEEKPDVHAKLGMWGKFIVEK